MCYTAHMESLIKADIFFLVTTIVVVLIALLSVVLFYYLIRFARNVYIVSKEVKAEIGAITHAVRTAREFIEQKGGSAIRFVSRFIPTETPPDKKKAKKKISVKSNNE